MWLDRRTQLLLIRDSRRWPSRLAGTWGHDLPLLLWRPERKRKDTFQTDDSIPARWEFLGSDACLQASSTEEFHGSEGQRRAGTVRK